MPEEYPPGSGLKVVETMMTFFDHEKIKEVHFPPTLKTIGMATFGCVYLPGEKTHVYIPSSVTTFEENWCGVININPVQKQLFFHCAKGSIAYSVGSARPFVTVVEDGSMAVKELPEMKTYAFGMGVMHTAFGMPLKVMSKKPLYSMTLKAEIRR